MTAPDLDGWLPRPAVRTRHRRTADAGPHAVWEAAMGVRLEETRTLGRLVQWRIPEASPSASFRDLLATHPFAVLDEGECWSVSGLCGRIWTTRDDYPDVGPEEFRGWDESGTVRVLMAHWVQEEPDGRSTIVSEARVQPTDRRAQWALRSLWVAVSPFERLIGAEPLSLVVRRAEAAAAS